MLSLPSLLARLHDVVDVEAGEAAIAADAIGMFNCALTPLFRRTSRCSRPPGMITKSVLLAEQSMPTESQIDCVSPSRLALTRLIPAAPWTLPCRLCRRLCRRDASTLNLEGIDAEVGAERAKSLVEVDQVDEPRRVAVHSHVLQLADPCPRSRRVRRCRSARRDRRECTSLRGNDGMADTRNKAAARNTLCTIRLRTLTSCRPGLTWPGKLCDQRIRRKPHPVQTLLTTWTNSSHEPASLFQQASCWCTLLLRGVCADPMPVTVELGPPPYRFFWPAS